MSKNIGKHQVTFNLNDPEQKEAYDYLNSFPNVSGKIKRLVFQDMAERGQLKRVYLKQGEEIKEVESIKETPIPEIKPISKIALDSIL